MFKSGHPGSSTKPNQAPKVVQRLLFEVMKEANLAWNTSYSAKEANSTNSCEK
jgi:hypothetical protein